jgi:uncharacterized membrane protein
MIKYLPELLKENVISQDVADRISGYYQTKKAQNPNRLFVVFGILGAFLVGLGLILIIAHNWDELSRPVKSGLAFLPLIVGQILCGYVLMKKNHNISWQEGTSTFLFFAIGASISLISQIYNISGNLSTFILTWMLLSLPLIYIMRSSFASLLFISGITYYACNTGYWTYPYEDAYFYWPLMLLIIPYYILLTRKKAESNFVVFHNWIIPLSLIITLGTIAKNHSVLMYIAYFNLLGVFYFIGDAKKIKATSQRISSYYVLGYFGTIILLFFLSFEHFWTNFYLNSPPGVVYLYSREFYASLILFVLALVFLVRKSKRTGNQTFNLMDFIFMIIIITFIIGYSGTSFSFILINLLILSTGITILLNGAKTNHLGLLNIGLLIITALVGYRFFDTDLSFLTRGILFIILGVGFFYSNYWILNKRKVNEK